MNGLKFSKNYPADTTRGSGNQPYELFWQRAGGDMTRKQLLQFMPRAGLTKPNPCVNGGFQHL